MEPLGPGLRALGHLWGPSCDQLEAKGTPKQASWGALEVPVAICKTQHKPYILRGLVALGPRRACQSVLGASWVLLDGSGPPPGESWAPLGAAWAAPGLILAAPGALLGLFWLLLEASSGSPCGDTQNTVKTAYFTWFCPLQGLGGGPKGTCAAQVEVQRRRWDPKGRVARPCRAPNCDLYGPAEVFRPVGTHRTSRTLKSVESKNCLKSIP